MPTLLWDKPGERIYESGVDRAVLYLPGGGAVAWNGLISVNEKVVGNDGAPVYYDGVKYGEAMGIGDYAATIKAYTYPDEFLELEGIDSVGNGLYVGNQAPRRFGLSYRTMIGNDIEGSTADYKIHILYNLTAYPSQKNYQTSSGNDALQFEWNITAIPDKVSGHRPTAHAIFDSRYMGPLFLKDMENTLYGDGISTPELPPISSLVSFASGWVIIRITDNNDGTWTAEGPDELITMLDPTTFQIIQANAVYLDANTYMVSDYTY